MNVQQKRFMRFPEVSKVSGLARTAIYAKINNGEFPSPYPLSDDGRAVGWLSTEIDAWIEKRIKIYHNSKKRV